MKAIIQRVSEASVIRDNEKIASINEGLLIFLGIHEDDGEEDLVYTVRKCTDLRIFEDHEGKMNLSIDQAGGEFLVVSEFTIYGDTTKGRRPSFAKAMDYKQAKEVYNSFVNMLKNKDYPVKSGEFGAKMDVSLTNDGPVTLIVDSKL